MEMLLTVEQAAERLQLAPFTVREHLKRGKLRGIKRGRVWRVPESALFESSPRKGPEKAAPTAVSNTLEGIPQSPLAQALAMVRERDAGNGAVKLRRMGIDDVATEIRIMREERTP